MICWVLGWQVRVTETGMHWRPVVYGAVPDILPGEPCAPTLVTPHKHEATCKRCREACEKRGANVIEAYVKKLGLE
jgi:hypothetical protein